MLTPEERLELNYQTPRYAQKITTSFNNVRVP